MAHNCPECGIACNCNGDIDDIILNCDDDVNGCIHCWCDLCKEAPCICVYEEEEES